MAAAPDRRPGGAGDRRTAARVARALREQRLPGRARSASRHAGDRLVNVIGRRAGRSRRQIVVVADRDARWCPTPPAAPPTPPRCSSWRACSRAAPRARRSCSRRSTARPSARWARRELLSRAARPGAGRRGARDVRPGLADPPRAVRAGVVDRRAARGHRPPAHGRGVDPARARRRCPASPGTLGQLARLSFPIGIGPQGVLLEHGYDAVRIAGSGELPPERQRAGGVDRRGQPRRARARHAAHGHGARPRAAARARPGQLRDRGQPGDAGLGALAAGRARCCCRRWWRPWTPSPARAASTWTCCPGCAGSAPGWRRSWPGSRSPSCSRWSGPPRRPRPRRCRRTCCRSTARRWACSPAWPPRWRSRCVLARFLAARPDPRLTPARAARRRGGAGAGGDRRGAAAVAGQPVRRAARGAGRAPVAAGAGGARAADRRVRGAAARARRAAGAAGGGLLPVRALDRPAERRVVPAAAGDRAHRRAADGAGRLRDAGRAVRRRSSSSTARRREAAEPPEASRADARSAPASPSAGSPAAGRSLLAAGPRVCRYHHGRAGRRYVSR